MAGGVSGIPTTTSGGTGSTSTVAVVGNPCLRVRFEGDGAEGKGIDIVIPRGLSLRVARMHAIEQIGKSLKGQAVTDVLKAMGFK